MAGINVKTPVFEDPKLNALVASLGQQHVTKYGAPAAPVVKYAGGYQAPDLSNFVPNYSKQQLGLLAQAGVSPSKAATDPKIYQILQQVDAMNKKLQHPENTSHRHGLLSRVFDIIQRPLYAVSEGARKAIESEAQGKGIGNAIGAFGSGAVQGIEGKKKTDFIQVLHEAGQLHHLGKQGENVQQAIKQVNAGSNAKSDIPGWLQVAGGLGLDVAGDPLTYTGVGLVGKAADVAKAGKEAETAIQGLKVADKLSPETKDLLSGAAYRGGKVSQKFAQAQEPKIGQLAQTIAKAEGAHKYEEVIGKLGNAEVGTHAEVMTAAKEAARQREAQVAKNILDNYNKVVGTAIPKQLALRAGPAKLGIPGTDLIAAATKGAIGRVDPVAKSINYFAKHFSTLAGSNPEAHSQVLSHFNMGMNQANFYGRELNRSLGPLGDTGREESWLAALNGHPSSHLVTMPDGTKIDAAHYMSTELHVLQQAMEDKGLMPKDLQPWLSGKLPLKIGRIKGPKGKMVSDPNWLTTSLKNWPVKDGGKALWFLHHAVAKADAYKTMLHSLGESFGATLPKEATDAQKALFKSLQGKGWTQAEKIPELSNHIFDPETAKYISHIAHTLRDQRQFNRFWAGFARIQKPIKFALTLPNPSFHWHNAVGDAFVNHLDNVAPWDYRHAYRVLRHRNQWFEQYNPTAGRFPLLTQEGDPLLAARNAQKPDLNANLFKNTSGLRSADGKVHSHITEAEIYAGYNKFGLRQNYASELGFNPPGPVGNFRNLVDKITSASEAREDYFRMAHFAKLVRTNPSKAKTLEGAMEFAARRVRQTHFDYTDFTKFEKEVMSQMVPFYKWTRKALPLMSQIMLTDPGKAVLVPKGLRALADMSGNPGVLASNDTLPNLQGAIVPKWMMDSGYVPVAQNFMGKGYPAFSYVPNPWSDLFTQQLQGLSDGGANLGQLAFGQASPLIKDPLEMILNKNLFTGGKIINTDPGKASKVQQILDYFAGQIPATNVAMRSEQQKNLAPLASWAGPVSVQADTPQRQKSELVRQRDVARAKLRMQKYQQQHQKK